MGYSTDFEGRLNITPQLSKNLVSFLQDFSKTRRVARNVDDKYGVEGEFYIKDDSEGVINVNQPPRTQPGLWCGWTVDDEGMHLCWDESEKFYDYVEWLHYLINNFFAPLGHVLHGSIDWMGEDVEDQGSISVDYNTIKVFKMSKLYAPSRRLAFSNKFKLWG